MPNKLVQNFGKNVSFTPATFAEPSTEQEVLELLRKHRDQPIRVISSGHAWSSGIQTPGLLISLKNINHVQIDPTRDCVRVGAGCQLRSLLPQLESSGLTLPSLGLIDVQTVAGATATGTHGSGKHSLSHYILAARIAHYDPETGEPTITEVDSGEALQAARCSLGLLGVIVELKLETRAAYRVEEHTQRHDSLESVLAAEEQYPLQQFFLIPWSWQLLAQHRVETTQPRSASAGLYRAYWKIGLDWGLHLAIYLLAKILRIRTFIRGFYRFVFPLTVIRNWRVVDDSHPMLTMKHELFRHIEIELFVTRSQLAPALEYLKNAIRVFGGQPLVGEMAELVPAHQKGSYCHHYPICIRRVLPDETLISMASPIDPESDENWYAISLVSLEWPSRRAGFFAFANSLALAMKTQFRARSHWGKFNPLDRESNASLYPRMREFRKAVKQFDPQSRFANEWLKNAVLEETE